jgi:hypothetical protein
VELVEVRALGFFVLLLVLDAASELESVAGSAYQPVGAHTCCASSVYLSILKCCRTNSTYVIQKKPKIKADMSIKIRLLFCTSMLLKKASDKFSKLLNR